MKMEDSEFPKKFSRDVPAPNTLNLEMEIPLYLQSPITSSGQGVGDAATVKSHALCRRVVFCFGNQGATAEILFRDRVPGTNDLTGISRKLRDGFGSTWPRLLYRSTNSQVTVFGFNLLRPAPPLPFELVRAKCTLRFWTDIELKRLEIPFAEESAEARRRKTCQ